MVRPLIGVALAGVFVAYGLLGYADRLPRSLPAVMRRPGNLRWLGGTLLLAAGVALGIVGWIWEINLRLVRIVLLLLGLALLLLA